ncbi:MAG TPA: hypothetical protein VKM93_00185 [Terriglobia bacterium]|nr:hypothetical protein [Terriglobia bacterium]
MKKRPSTLWFTTALLAALMSALAATLGARQSSPAPAATPASSKQSRATRSAQAQEPARPPLASNPQDPETMEITKRDLNNLLRRYPQANATLRLDQSLVADQEYLDHYPDLRDFLKAHPEVVANPSAFIESSFRVDSQQGGDPVFLRFMNDLWPFLVFLVVTAALLWILKVILENRRWGKMAKVQSEAHAKLLEKFATNQELLAYMQTEAGKRFLESAPIPVDLEQRPRMSAPFGRILWSVQLGFILALAGLGLIYVRGYAPDVAEELLVFGTLALTLGLGFVLSALVSFGLSKHLGLLTNAPVKSLSD